MSNVPWCRLIPERDSCDAGGPVLELRGNLVRIGRLPTVNGQHNDVVLNFVRISAVHAVLSPVREADPPAAHLRSVAEKGGVVFVDDRHDSLQNHRTVSCGGEATVHSGDKISFLADKGRYLRFTVELVSPVRRSQPSASADAEPRGSPRAEIGGQPQSWFDSLPQPQPQPSPPAPPSALQPQARGVVTASLVAQSTDRLGANGTASPQGRGAKRSRPDESGLKLAADPDTAPLPQPRSLLQDSEEQSPPHAPPTRKRKKRRKEEEEDEEDAEEEEEEEEDVEEREEKNSRWAGTAGGEQRGDGGDTNWNDSGDGNHGLSSVASDGAPAARTWSAVVPHSAASSRPNPHASVLKRLGACAGNPLDLEEFLPPGEAGQLLGDGWFEHAAAFLLHLLLDGGVEAARRCLRVATVGPWRSAHLSICARAWRDLQGMGCLGVGALPRFQDVSVLVAGAGDRVSDGVVLVQRGGGGGGMAVSIAGTGPLEELASRPLIRQSAPRYWVSYDPHTRLLAVSEVGRPPSPGEVIVPASQDGQLFSTPKVLSGALPVPETQRTQQLQARSDDRPAESQGPAATPVLTFSVARGAPPG